MIGLHRYYPLRHFPPNTLCICVLDYIIGMYIIEASGWKRGKPVGTTMFVEHTFTCILQHHSPSPLSILLCSLYPLLLTLYPPYIAILGIYVHIHCMY